MGLLQGGNQKRQLIDHQLFFFCAPGASILEHFLVGFGCDLGYGAVFSTTIMENYFFAIYYGIGNFFLSCNVRIND